MAGKTLATAIASFGASAKARLASPAIEGSPEDQLRGPLETLLHDLSEVAGFLSGSVQLIGETKLAHGVLRQIAATVGDDQGPGAVRGAIEAAAQRVIGFELQFGPFAVAQLRLIAEMQSLMKTPQKPYPVIPPLKLFITDTLGNPFVEDEYLPQVMKPVAQSRRGANKIKREAPITVVIGNPPYKEKAEGRGGWIESGSEGHEAPLDRWKPPPEWGMGAHLKHLKNLYIYFWRWATWKVFGAGLSASTGLPESDKEGIVCFITVAGFLNGPGFDRMRDDLRRICSEICVVDCTPEGHQPDVPTRVFQAVQQPVCIVLAARKLGKPNDTPAKVRFSELPEGKRQTKFAALAQLSLHGPGWRECPSGWREPFLPRATGAWASFPALADLFIYNGSGVMPGRTWIIAPDKESLSARWQRLIKEQDEHKKAMLFHPHLRNGKPGDKHVSKSLKKGLLGHEERLNSVANDHKSVIERAGLATGRSKAKTLMTFPNSRLGSNA